jgi:hypothetical protein
VRRDEIFATEIAAAAERNGLRTVTIDRAPEVNATAAAPSGQFGL